jgi:hypothetical protein
MSFQDEKQTMKDIVSSKGFGFPQPPPACGLIKQSWRKWRKPTCNLL